MACADVRKQRSKIDWVVYAKRPFAGPKQVLGYLSRYTHQPTTACSYKSGDVHYDSLVPREWFGKVSMQRINVLSIQRIGAEDRAKIEAVDPAIELTDAGGWYDGEIRETWPAFTTARYLAPGATGSGTP